MTRARLATAAVVAALAVAAAGCAHAPAVQHVGPMRDVMREGRTEARARLSDHASPGTYGVGALTGLAGELVVDDGVAWTAVGDTVAEPAAADATATLLTTARVAAWTATTTAAAVDLAGLEDLLRRAAPDAAARRDVVPFVVDGRGDVELHVVRGACPHGDPSPERAPIRRSGTGVPLRLIGFFAPGREGELTHHGTALHVHVLATDGPGRVHLGHVDAVRLQAGAQLRVAREP